MKTYDDDLFEYDPGINDVKDFSSFDGWTLPEWEVYPEGLLRNLYQKCLINIKKFERSPALHLEFIRDDFSRFCVSSIDSDSERFNDLSVRTVNEAIRCEDPNYCISTIRNFAIKGQVDVLCRLLLLGFQYRPKRKPGSSRDAWRVHAKQVALTAIRFLFIEEHLSSLAYLIPNRLTGSIDPLPGISPPPSPSPHPMSHICPESRKNPEQTWKPLERLLAESRKRAEEEERKLPPLVERTNAPDSTLMSRLRQSRDKAKTELAQKKPSPTLVTKDLISGSVETPLPVYPNEMQVFSDGSVEVKFLVKLGQHLTWRSHLGTVTFQPTTMLADNPWHDLSRCPVSPYVERYGHFTGVSRPHHDMKTKRQLCREEAERDRFGQ